MKKILCILTLALITYLPVNAQFSLEGEVRPRTDFYNGNNSSLSVKYPAPGVATQQRIRLYFYYKKDRLTYNPQNTITEQI